MTDTTRWMVCSACRADIAYGARHYTCSVSTCNRERMRLVFCTVSCWDSHVATLRHRDAAAVEALAPAGPDAASERDETTAPARRFVPTSTPAAAPAAPVALAAADESEILIVVSKMKKYIRDRSGMNTSDAVAAVLSDHVRAICDQAIRAAGAAERKTVLDRDVPPARR